MASHILDASCGGVTRTLVIENRASKRNTPVDRRVEMVRWDAGIGTVIRYTRIHFRVHNKGLTLSDVTRILSQIESGNPSAAEELLPLVYDELRKLAAAKFAQEKPGQTLQPTALVHEVYLRLVGKEASQQSWDGRSHFFAAASEAMRRILVESARRKSRDKHGGQCARADADLDGLIAAETADPLVILAVHEALDRLAERSSRKAELVKLRYFVGCTLAEAAEILGISHATAEEDWTFARTWLRREWLRGQSPDFNSTK